MALIFIDSFDHYATADIGRKWTSNQSGSINANGRWDNCYGGNTNNHDLVKLFGTNYSTLIVGFAMYWTNWRNDQAFFIFRDGGSSQFWCSMNSAHQIVCNGHTGSTVILANTWYYFEFKATFHNSAGSWEIRLNESTEISGSSEDTSSTGNAYANGMHITSSYYIGASNGHTFRVDDLYVCDNSGSTNNDFLGDVRVESLYPSDNGFTSNLVGSDADSTDNYLLVDDPTPDNDTTWVASDTPGDKDTYTFSDPTPVSGTVYGVQIAPLWRKTDAGTAAMRSIARLSGTEEESGDETLLDTYQYGLSIRETKPGGGSWSWSDLQNAEFGMKVV